MTYQEIQNGLQAALAFQKLISKECKTTNIGTALSQQWVGEHYKGTVVNAHGYDVIAADGRKIQVKARWYKDSKPSGIIGGWNPGEETEADLWVFIGFDENYKMIFAFEQTPAQVQARTVKMDKLGKVSIQISKKLLKEVGSLLP